MSSHLSTAIFDAEARAIQAQLYSKLTGENVRLLKELAECKQRQENAEAQVLSLEKPESSARNENAILRTELRDAQTQLKTLQHEVDVEKQKRVAAEEAKEQLFIQHIALSTENARLIDERDEIERGRDSQFDHNLNLNVEHNVLQDTIATLRVDLEGRDREMRELTESINVLQTELEKAQNVQPEARPSTLSLLDTVTQDMTYEAMMQERRTLGEQLAAAQKENEDYKAKVALLEAAIQSGAGTIAPSTLHRTGSRAQQASSSKTTSSKPSGRRNTGKKGGPVNFTDYASPIPPARLATLVSYPVVNISLPPDLEGPVSFTKTTLSKVIGGSNQGLFVKVTKSAQPLALKYDIGEYLCPNLNQNSWLPTKPGTHGYMQVGLGDHDRARFEEAEIRPVFIGAESQFRYFGTYELQRAEALTPEEWLTLPEKSQHEYSETTKNKEKAQQGRNVRDILQDYRSGNLRAPCVLLKCIGFDTEFYTELLEAARAYNTALGTVTASSLSSQVLSASSAPAAKVQKRTAENRFHVEDAEADADEVQGSGPSYKRRRVLERPPSNASVRRSGRLSAKPRLFTGNSVDGEDSDGTLSDWSMELSGGGNDWMA